MRILNRKVNLTILYSLLLIATLPAATLAQKDISGKTWTRWEGSHKEAYLRGLYAGFKVDRVLLREAQGSSYRRNPMESDPLTSERYKAARKEYFARSVKYDFKLLRDLVDVFYTHPDNLLIPVPEAVRIVMLQQAGNTVRADFLLQRERRKTLEGK